MKNMLLAIILNLIYKLQLPWINPYLLRPFIQSEQLLSPLWPTCFFHLVVMCKWVLCLHFLKSNRACLRIIILSIWLIWNLRLLLLDKEIRHKIRVFDYFFLLVGSHKLEQMFCLDYKEERVLDWYLNHLENNDYKVFNINRPKFIEVLL